MDYETHDFPQGSPEWHANRAICHNASELSAAKGNSPYKSREKLIQQIATGKEEIVDEATQKRFDDGHLFEALARPLAEKFIGEDLFPSVLSVAVPGLSRRLGVSMDGKTMSDEINWEHKTLNANLSASLDQGVIPEMYHDQMEQGMMINGASKCLFSASKWKLNTDSGEYELVDTKHAWYESNPDLRALIIPIWKQVEIDVANYKHVDVIPAAVAEPADSLPVLFVQAKGEITKNNLADFGEATKTYLASLKTDLVTDQDFANAKAAAVDCREAVKSLDITKTQMLAQTVTIGEACNQIDKWKEEYRLMALKLEKDVERETEARQVKILNDVKAEYSTYVQELEAEIGPIRLNINAPDFVAAMKGKKSIKGWQDAVSAALANGKVAATASAKDLRAKLAWIKENAAEYGFLFSDLQQIIQKPDDDFRLVVTTRVSAHKAEQQKKLDDEREKIRKEEQERADKEAAEKVAAAAAVPAPVVEVPNTPQQAVRSPVPEIVPAPATTAHAQPTMTPAGMPDYAKDIIGLIACMNTDELKIVAHYCQRVISQRQVAA